VLSPDTPATLFSNPISRDDCACKKEGRSKEIQSEKEDRSKEERIKEIS